MATRRFASRARGALPARQWTEISSTWTQSVTATTATVLWGLQAPAAGTGLTALPPEDIIIMRIRGSFNCTLSATSQWVLGLTVQDQTWTPSAVFQTDADKRWLWLRTFESQAGTLPVWTGSKSLILTGSVDSYPAYQDVTEVDISPKVKLESGQGLYLVAYEQNGAATWTCASINMRMLWQCKRRR